MKNFGDMKKIYLLLTLFIMSCSPINILTVGDIMLLNDNGDIVRCWDNSVIDINQKTKTHSNTYIYSGSMSESGESVTNSLKNSGVNFWDKYGDYHYISGTVYIDNIKIVNLEDLKRQEDETKKRQEDETKRSEQINELLNRYNELDKLSSTYMLKMETLSGDDSDREYWIMKYRSSETEKNKILKTLWEKYKFTLN